MGVTSHLEPKKVFHFFEEISKIPHGSYNTRQISDYLAGFAKDRGLEYVQDSLNNVIIYGPATEGYEDSEPVLLQGHMDMVCEKVPGCEIDMSKEGIRLMIDGDWLTADGTTLGGDDGIAVAMMLALLDSDEYEHPALECIFTVDEETGLEGAEGFDAALLHGTRMLNLDSEEEGIITVSCAGGITARPKLPVTRAKTSGTAYKIRLSGTLGGHSGMEIHKGRINANVLMGRVLSELSDHMAFLLRSLAGGSADNVICNDCTAEILVLEDASKLPDYAAGIEQVIKEEYQTSDPNLSITVEPAGEGADPLDEDSTARIIAFLLNTPNGIINMSMDIQGLVETSLNLGAVKLEENELTTLYAIRSSVKSRQDFVCRRLKNFTEALGGIVEFSLYYPGWQYLADSPLRDTCVKVFRDMYGKDPSVEAVHAGLECGFFAEKCGKGFDAVSIGPDLQDVHSPNEKLSISSTKRVWEYVLEVLKELK